MARRFCDVQLIQTSLHPCCFTTFTSLDASRLTNTFPASRRDIDIIGSHAVSMSPSESTGVHIEHDPMLRDGVKTEESEEESKLHILEDAEEDDSEDDSSRDSADPHDTTNTTNIEEDQNPSTSFLEAEHILGPRTTIPNNILNLLEEWHREYPSTFPECSYRNKKPKRPSKVFDRSGKELFLSVFLIKKPIKYTIIFLHDVDGPGKLVACLSRSPNFSFLLGWNGLEKGYEAEVEAVRQFGRTEQDIVFSPQTFERAPAQPRPLRNATSSRYGIPSHLAPKTTTTTTTTTNTNGQKPQPRRSDASQATRTARQPVPDPESESVSEFETESETDSSSSEAEDSKQIPTRPAKRLKTNSPITRPPPTKSREMAFKLVSENSDATRCFPMSECSTGTDLFAKAKKFYNLVDDELKVTVLSCRIPSKHERRYLFQGSEGEFNMLLHDVNGVQGVSGEKTLIVEVRSMD